NNFPTFRKILIHEKIPVRRIRRDRDPDHSSSVQGSVWCRDKKRDRVETSPQGEHGRIAYGSGKAGRQRLHQVARWRGDGRTCGKTEEIFPDNGVGKEGHGVFEGHTE